LFCLKLIIEKVDATLGRTKQQKKIKTFNLMLKVFYFVSIIFLLDVSSKKELFAQKKKAYLIFESDISSPTGISNKAFRKGLSGVVNVSSCLLLSTPNSKRNFGVGYQFTSFKAGLNANNISGNNNTMLSLNSIHLKIGNIFYTDYMFKIQGTMQLNYNFFNAKNVEVPAGNLYDGSTKRFFSYQPGIDLFLKAQENIFVGFKISYNYLVYKYNPEEYFLNDLKQFTPNDYSKNVGFLNFGLSFRFEFNKNPDE
jgi:hypothetical protein